MEFVPFHIVGAEIAKVIPKHAAEVKQYGKLSVDWDYYLDMSHKGFCYAVYQKDKGYAVFLLGNDPHQKNDLEANNSAFYVEPAHRGQLAIDIIKFANEQLKKLGVKRINYMVFDDKIGKLLARYGYKPTHTLWSLDNE